MTKKTKAGFHSDFTSDYKPGFKYLAAYPPLHPIYLEWTENGEPRAYLNGGISQRKYIATMAMQGLLANAAVQYQPGELALKAAEFADALIKQLKNK